MSCFEATACFIQDAVTGSLVALENSKTLMIETTVAGNIDAQEMLQLLKSHI